MEGRPGYHGGIVQFSARRQVEPWSKLTECVRTGAPVTALDRPEDAASFWGELVPALFSLNYPAAAQLGRELRRIHPEGELRLLDVAAGSGVWGTAPAQADPAIRVAAFDLPDTLVHTRRTVEQFGLQDRFEFRAGDIRKNDLGDAEFDAAILGHICHSEGAEHSRRLIAKAARALKPGGTIAIAETIPADDRSGPPFPLLFALNMLVFTTEGDTFTLAEFETWLRDAGFQDIRTLQTPSPSPLILATRG